MISICAIDETYYIEQSLGFGRMSCNSHNRSIPSIKRFENTTFPGTKRPCKLLIIKLPMGRLGHFV